MTESWRAGVARSLLGDALWQELREQFDSYATADGSSLLGGVLVSVWLLFAQLFLQPRVVSQPSWQLPLVFFPHINFCRPRISDILRLPLQCLWLIFFRQHSSRWARQQLNAGRRALLSPIVAGWTHLHGWFRIGHGIFYRLMELGYERHVEVTEPTLHTARRRRDWGPLYWLLVALVGVAILLCLTVPFDLYSQLVFLLVLIGSSLVLRSLPGAFPGVLMVLLSVTVSSRYIWWRCTASLNWDDTLGLVFGLVLLAAELFAWLVLLLGYFQNVWPLRRKIVALPADPNRWPTVDVLVPSYNEDLDVVKATVYACMGMDWPQDKLKIYILDDGRRDSFKEFADEVGVNYIRRSDNRHAKAGNINNALAQCDSEYVAIFDCDHIPTRPFLQVCMGWFLKDPKMALVQTPHHFFSPDPFERNLDNFRDVPSEGGLFYGLIQDGNDLWNATFFCGSCAVMRRSALLEVGGIAVETVTEDAHTALKMHRLGYRSAYLRMPVAAGLATETLSAHIGQRIRWARGMAQIFRLDNPLRGPGLRWQQRLCYLNAMMHYFSGVPRLIFLTAPLAFLVFHTYIIYAPPLILLLSVLPHMFLAATTNSRLQGKYRYSFWGEVYETALSWYIARPTTVALFAPHKGTFNVTAKGGIIDSAYYDWIISKPYITLVGLNVLGAGFGLYRLFLGPGDEVTAVIMNLTWTLYNLIILGAAVAVAAEARQKRINHRVEVTLDASVRLASGHTLPAVLRDFSLGGLRLEVADHELLKDQRALQVILYRGRSQYSFPMSVVYRSGGVLGLQLDKLTTGQLVAYVQCTFARADTWLRWVRSYKIDKPANSMATVVTASLSGYRQLLAACPQPIPWLVSSVRSVWDGVLSLLPRQIKGVVD